MTVIRRVNRPADQFVMVTNQFARDRSLSLPARGLGLWLLSHSEGWEITATRLAKEEGIGRDKLRGYLRELEDAGYLRRERERIHGGRLGGMLYEISCTPVPPEKPRSNLRLDGQGLVDQGRVPGPHKKTTPKETNTQGEQDPSRGATADAAPRSLETQSPDSREEPMRNPAPPQPGLFDLPADPSQPVRARQAGKNTEHRQATAQQVVAAYVDSFAAHHSGGRPLKADVGRVARDAAALLNRGEAGPDELTKAAVDLGKGRFSNLGMSLKIMRDRGTRHAGKQSGVPARPHTDPYWQAVAERQAREWHQKLLIDDDSIRWVKRDPAEVERIVAQWPDLADRFRDIA